MKTFGHFKEGLQATVIILHSTFGWSDLALFAMFEIRYVFMIPKKLPTLSVLGSDSGAAEFSFFLSHKDLKNDFIFRKFAETFLLYGVGNSLLVF